MLTPAEAGAGVCLDGSPPALYYVAAKSAAHNASWVVMLQGGGWCVDEASCAERSRTSLGSTAQLAATARTAGLRTRLRTRLLVRRFSVLVLDCVLRIELLSAFPLQAQHGPGTF